MTIFYVAYAIVGIGIIIFVHELGHFLAAKKVGVRVERFCIGFDPPFRGRNLRFVSFRKGETEYALGVIPFGGYVKMAGETDLSPDKTGARDELMSKSVGARAFVFVAGAAMNILSAFIFFIIAFSIGVQFTRPEVAMVEMGSPAWKAGILPDDRLLAVNGEEVMEFTEVMVAVALGSPSDPVRLTIARPAPEGGPERVMDLTVAPEWNQSLGLNRIGIHPGLSNQLAKAVPESPAARAGLPAGGRVVGLRIDGRETGLLRSADVLELYARLREARPREAVEIQVIHDGAPRWVTLAPEAEQGARPHVQIGIGLASGNIVREIRPGSEAARFFEKGDQVLKVGDRTVTTIEWLGIHETVLNGLGTDGSLILGIRSVGDPLGVPTRTVTVNGEAFLRWQISGDIFWGAHGPTFEGADSDSALAKAGLKAGDTIVEVDGAPCYSIGDLSTAGEKQSGDSSTVLVLRNGTTEKLNLPRTELKGASDGLWGRSPLLGIIVRGGPAHQAGIEPGSRILEIEGRPVHTWRLLTEAVNPKERFLGFLWGRQTAEPGRVLDVAWETPGGERKNAKVTVGLPAMKPLLTFEPRQEIHRTGILDACALGARRTVVVAEWVFLTLRSLIGGQVSPRNLQGPVGITHVLTRVSEQGLGTMIYFLAIISVNLGLFNLLPFPILDGGHLLFLAIEKIKGTPVDVRVQEWSMNIAFLLIIMLAVFVTFNDLTRLLG
jgi:RIP metalloprotease RseP